MTMMGKPDCNFSTHTSYLTSNPTLVNYLKQYLALPHTYYPPRHIQRTQQRWARRHLEARPSTFANGGFGLFALTDLPEGTILGVYGGQLHTHSPAYTDYALQLTSPSPQYNKYVDASSTLTSYGYLGFINEYIWTHDTYDPMSTQNCRFLTNGTGIVVTTTDISADTELTIYLGPSYDWSNLCYTLYQQEALAVGINPTPIDRIVPCTSHHNIISAISDVTLPPYRCGDHTVYNFRHLSRAPTGSCLSVLPIPLNQWLHPPSSQCFRDYRTIANNPSLYVTPSAVTDLSMIASKQRITPQLLHALLTLLLSCADSTTIFIHAPVTSFQMTTPLPLSPLLEHVLVPILYDDAW